jgi:hypothetical protein
MMIALLLSQGNGETWVALKECVDVRRGCGFENIIEEYKAQFLLAAQIESYAKTKLFA